MSFFQQKMEFKILFVLSFWVAVPLTLEEIHGSVKFHPMTQKRSIKDTFPKDDYTKTSAINYVRNKIFSLEDSVKKAEERIQQLSNQNEELEESMLVQKSLLQTIAGEFSGIQKGLSSHGYRLNDLDELTNPTKTFFITSNQTCGGVLVGEMGSILFSRRSSANPRLPSNCMWTVRAKNREFIKVSKLVTLSFSSNNKVYAIEITKMITSGNDASSQLPHIKTTELLDNTHHLFAGPVIFIMAAINSQSYIDLHLQFEGIGKIIEKNTFFAHATLVANPMGNFSSSEMTTWSPSSLEEVDGKTNYTLDYTTIVVSNFTTKVHLQAVIGNGGCSEGESFIVISDLKENQTSVNDCCKVNCTGRNSLINYDNPYIILIHKKFQRPLTFNLTWIADPVYLPLSNASSCGGIVGGTDGNIRYKPSLPYGNNERCIWVIVPQSIPRSSIEIKVLSNGITDTDDHLYVMELTDVNGQELEGGPKITSLAQRSSSYVAQSREVYIVFYTDSAVSGYGFSVEWTSSGDLVRDGSDIETQFEYYKNDNGSALSVSKKAMFTNYLYHVFIFTPKLSPTYNSGLQLELNQTFPAFDEKNCVQAQFYIPVHGVLTKTPISCNHSSQAFLQNADGMAVIVMMKSQTAHPNLAMDFNWKQGPLAVNRTEVVVQDDRCGGVIIGDMGVLKYKTDRHILVNERCLWLLNAPTSTNITFKLENNGFDNGLYSGLYTFILVTTINPSTGKLRNDTKEINRANMSVKMNGSMIVIAFLSGATGRSTGFSLRFSSRDTFKTQSEYSYSLRHLSNTHGTVEYDGTGRINNVFVTASSAFRSEVNPTVDPQTAIDWSGGLFRKANDSCNYDSLKFYQPTYYIDGNGWLFGWLTGAKFPNHNETICPDVLSVPEKKSVFNSTSGFLAIYKPVSNPQKSGENETNHFRFKYYATVVYSSCTGTITEKSGHISYKENSQYSNRERCSWQINIPKAEMVTFYLESSGLGQCCDFVTIRSEDNLDGVRLSLANRNATMRGGKGEVTFSSDGSRTGYGFRLQFETIEDLDVRGQACGGVIQQQSGSITFARHESPSMPYHNFSTYYPSTCVWTVRANDSAAIKISTHPARKTLFSSYNSDTYLLEIVKTNTSENRTSSQIPQIKITKLQKNMQYMLTGPTIFVVTSLATQNGIDLYLQFEGVGKLEQNDTSYTHEALLGSSGSFNSNELEALSSPLLTILDDNNNNFTFDYTTIVVSNFSTKVHLQAIVGNGGCSNGESFFVITDVTKNRTVIKDCCKSECAGNNSLITYDNPFIILISKKYQEPFNFNFTWEADRIYPSSYNGSGQLTMPKCGEVLGGTSGTIEYQLYDKNDRCIWVIVPQPLPTSSIVIKVNSNGIYDSNDLLYMMELTDINGEELEDSPRITRFVGRNTYEAQGREVYIVFYADSSGSGTGFSLTWSLQGQIIEPRNDVATRFAFLKSINGSAANVWRKSLFTSSSYYAFIFTPTIPSTYKYGLQLHLQFNETLVGDGGNNCTRDELTIFSALNDLLTKTKGICDKPGEVILDEADGMAVIVLNSRQNVSSEMQLDFKWMDESNSASNSDLIENGDKCGGVIIGSRGVLSYKLDSNYLNGERCIWLLHSPNSTSITLKLLDDGFEKCCDYILVTTIDPQSGTLRNNTQQITRANRTQILQDPMVIIQFRSDWPDSRTGFALRFTAHGHRQHDYDFNLRHTSDSTGTFEFPAPGWNDTATGTRDIIHVMASSIVTKDDSDDHPRIPLAINWSGGVFQKANDSCDYNSIVFYEPTFFSYGGWITRAQFPNLNETLCSDEVTVPGKQKFYRSVYPAFLSIFKPLSPSRNDEVVTSYQFDYHQIASSFSCGGVIKADYGMGWISYKERTRYTNNEKCVWQVEIPQAVAISFQLDRSAVEMCCDYITVSSIESPAVKLTPYHDITTVKGSVANLTFTSDSSITAKGFRVSFGNSTVIEDENCGGVIIGDTGVLNYKDNKIHYNFERCVWLLHSPQSTNITLELVKDGFLSCCDHLLINTIDPNTGTLRNDTAAINRVNNTQTFQESLLVIIFRSDYSSRGGGFSLEFSGGGNNPSPTYIYKLRHVSDENGTITYPGSEWGDGPLASNEIFVLASSMNLRDWDDDQVSLNLHWDSGVFRKSNESCEYGSVMFYTSPKSNGWQTVGRIPSENATSSCSNVVTVPPKKRLFNFEDFSYLAVYKPNSGNQPQENATHFNFTFEMSRSCGGVYTGNSGEIIYEDNGRYFNDEICIWLVEVPGANAITFTLAKSGCKRCDFIAVSSVEAFKGIKLPARILASTNQTATISGSVAIVTFSSNARVIGYGFRLLFSSASEATAEYPYTYILGHSHQQKLIEFSQQVEPNQVVIFAYGRPFKHPSLVNITSFRPQVNESCYSDSLAVYEAYGKSSSDAFALKKTFTATDTGSIGTSTSCRAFDENQFSTCENIGDCSDAPDGSVVHLNTSSYVVIYSSVNVTGSLQLRGFALTSEL